MTVTAESITDDQIWEVARRAVRIRDVRLLGYCDAALRGGRRRGQTGRKQCAVVWNNTNLGRGRRAGKTQAARVAGQLRQGASTWRALAREGADLLRTLSWAATHKNAR
jgi:hypothetical protein